MNDPVPTGPAVPRRRALASLAGSAAAAGAFGLARAEAAPHPDRHVFTACAAFERADRAFVEVDRTFGAQRPGTADHAVAGGLAAEARKQLDFHLLDLCCASPATLAGHVARIRQVLRVAARFGGNDIDGVEFVDVGLVAAVFRDLALIDPAVSTL